MDYTTLLLTDMAFTAFYTFLACTLAWRDKGMYGLRLVSWGLVLELLTLVLRNLPLRIPDIFSVMLANELYLISFVLQMLGMRWFVVRTPLQKRWVVPLLVPLLTVYTALYLCRIPYIASLMNTAVIIVCGCTAWMLLEVKRGMFQRVSRITAALLVGELLVVLYRAITLKFGDPIGVTSGAVQHDPGALYSVMAMMSLTACIAACNLWFFVTELQNELIEQANTDPLTGALNRRALQAAANREIARSLRNGQPMCVLLLDIDHFKQINDTYGHSAGDAALQFLVIHVRKVLRSQDILARTGGEEFIAVLPETAKDSGTIVANRLRNSLDSAGWSYGGTKIPISLSIGVAPLEESHLDFETLMRRADKAMYEAKRRGRNQVLVYESGIHGNEIGVPVGVG